ncbi:MAG: ABC transporter ATP-binding protein [Actinomycetota bacterium]
MTVDASRAFIEASDAPLPAIRTNRLTKSYGKARGIVDLDLEIPHGEVFGYLGPNGAGKTTTIRLLLDFLRPSSGSAEVLGLDARAHSVEIRRQVGYLPGELDLYPTMTGRELLTYFGELRGGVDPGQVEELARRLDLDLDRHIRSLSKGNKQKIGIVQAFMHEPRVLILDEPTSGLDPLVQLEFQAFVHEATARGATVFLSSHVLSEVEEVAHRVGIVREGRLVAVEDVRSLKAKAMRSLEIRFAQPVPPDTFSNIGNVEARVDDGVAYITVQGSVDPVIKQAARFEVRDVISHEPDLEEIFLSYYRGPDRA